jgi:hypothetical protein
MSEMQIPVWNGPSPKPRDASTPAQRLIDLANLVPAGEWVSYGDLAEAYVVRNGANRVARGVASALSPTVSSVLNLRRTTTNFANPVCCRGARTAVRVRSMIAP